MSNYSDGDNQFQSTQDQEVAGAEVKNLASRWTELIGIKSFLQRRCEDYAMWTLPYIFPRLYVKEIELQGALDATGAKAVNNLANKLVRTLFGQPFFRLMVKDDFVSAIEKAAQNGDQDANNVLTEIDVALAKAEKAGMGKLENTGHMTQAIMAAKGLIITGNSLLYYPPKGKVQCYSLRDYAVVRDLSGNVIELMMVDKKCLYTFHKDVKDKLKLTKDTKYSDSNAEITIYTQVKLEDDGKFHLYQSADAVDLEAEGTWPREDLPWIPLTWNLIRGEDYGRGLVEDYAGAFHALYILAQAEVDLVGIAADIKFLVDPGATCDIKEINDSESGTYHSGKETDIHVIQINKIQDMQVVEGMVTRLQNSIGAAFLLQSSTTRQAERVTAEEIRSNANELEIAHAGIYSRFADDWQYPVAVLVLKGVNIDLGKGENKVIQPVIITGLDSLSKSGELDDLHGLIGDLVMLKEIPEPILAAIDFTKFIAFCAVRRGVDYEKFVKSAAQMQSEAQQQQQAQQQQAGVEASQEFAKSAGKAAIQNPQQQ